jgi:eIF-2B alpha/beta/delta-like uncharacterized protein
MTGMVETIQWTEAGVVMIDQTRLPLEERYVTCRTYEEVAEAIRGMVIRGAPAIGVAAAMGVALGVLHASGQQLDREVEAICDAIAGTRPTAVNLFWAIERMKRRYASVRGQPIGEIRRRLVEEALAVREEDIAINRAIGRNGAALVPDHKTVLTHCNAGALATAGYGTALGVVRAAIESGKQVDVFADETRPFLQGARLTVWELQHDGIPVTLITDNMAGHGKMVQIQESENQIITSYEVFSGGHGIVTCSCPRWKPIEDNSGKCPTWSRRMRRSIRKRTKKRFMTWASIVWRFRIATHGVRTGGCCKGRVGFKQAQRWRTGCEGRISVLKRRHGLSRCRYRGLDGVRRWQGFGVILVERGDPPGAKPAGRAGQKDRKLCPEPAPEPTERYRRVQNAAFCTGK